LLPVKTPEISRISKLSKYELHKKNHALYNIVYISTNP